MHPLETNLRTIRASGAGTAAPLLLGRGAAQRDEQALAADAHVSQVEGDEFGAAEGAEDADDQQRPVAQTGQEGGDLAGVVKPTIAAGMGRPWPGRRRPGAYCPASPGARVTSARRTASAPAVMEFRMPRRPAPLAVGSSGLPVSLDTGHRPATGRRRWSIRRCGGERRALDWSQAGQSR